MAYNIDFISENDFNKHVAETIQQYGEKLISYDLEKINKNILDPIKLIFDKMVYNSSWEEIIKNEIYRQRDKANNNSIGYFHQKIFQYIKDCIVPKEGWDVIFKPEGGINIDGVGRVSTVYVEMKNKHNTMNSASSAKTYIKAQAQLLQDDDCAVFLVEAIAKKSQNIPWSVTVDKQTKKHKLIRRVSMDVFYKIVTGQEDAFYKVCSVLPQTIDSVIANKVTGIPKDTAYCELQEIAETKEGSFAMALYMLGFDSYLGFQRRDRVKEKGDRSYLIVNEKCADYLAAAEGKESYT